jgi:hypothetical protein
MVCRRCVFAVIVRLENGLVSDDADDDFDEPGERQTHVQLRAFEHQHCYLASKQWMSSQPRCHCYRSRSRPFVARRFTAPHHRHRRFRPLEHAEM